MAYTPWDWNPEKDDPSFNEDKLFHHELSDYEINELEEQFNNTSKVKSFLKLNKDAQEDFNKKTHSMGSQLMLGQLTGWNNIFENEKISFMLSMVSKVGFDDTLGEDELRELMKSNLEHKDRVNMSVITAFAVAKCDLCKNKKKQKLILEEFENQKKHFAKVGELELTAFLLNVGTMKMWVEEMELKHKVFNELEELEKHLSQVQNKNNFISMG